MFVCARPTGRLASPSPPTPPADHSLLRPCPAAACILIFEQFYSTALCIFTEMSRHIKSAPYPTGTRRRGRPSKFSQVVATASAEPVSCFSESSLLRAKEEVIDPDAVLSGFCGSQPSPESIQDDNSDRSDSKLPSKFEILQGLELGRYIFTLRNESDVVGPVLDKNGKRVAFQCTVCNTLFSPNKGGSLKSHQQACQMMLNSETQKVTVVDDEMYGKVRHAIRKFLAAEMLPPSLIHSKGFTDFLNEIGQLYFKCGFVVNRLPSMRRSGAPRAETILPDFLNSPVNVTANDCKLMRQKLTHLQQQHAFTVILDEHSENQGFVQISVTFLKNWQLQRHVLDVIPGELKNLSHDSLVKELKAFGIGVEKVHFVASETPFFLTCQNSTKCLVAFVSGFVQNCFLNNENSCPALARVANEMRTVSRFVESASAEPTVVHELNSWLEESAWIPGLTTLKEFDLLSSNQSKCAIPSCDQNLLHQVRTILSGIEEQIDCLCANSSTTLNGVIGVLQRIESNLLASCSFAQEIVPVFQKMKSEFLQDEHIFAHILDPAIKNELYKMLPKDDFLGALERFGKAVAALSSSRRPHVTPSSTAFNPYATSVVSEATLNIELEHYFAVELSTPKETFDLCKWWSEHEAVYPNIARLAAKLFAIPSVVRLLPHYSGFRNLSGMRLLLKKQLLQDLQRENIDIDDF